MLVSFLARNASQRPNPHTTPGVSTTLLLLSGLWLVQGHVRLFTCSPGTFQNESQKSYEILRFLTDFLQFLTEIVRFPNSEKSKMASLWPSEATVWS